MFCPLEAIMPGKNPFAPRLAHSFIFHTQQGWSFLTPCSSSLLSRPASHTHTDEMLSDALRMFYTPVDSHAKVLKKPLHIS